MNKLRFTREGLNKLRFEYDELLKSRPDAVLHLKKSRELGDLSENGYYKASRAKLNSIDNRLIRLKMIFKQAEVVEVSNSGIVQIGSRVVLADGAKESIYEIAGDLEANPREGKISLLSPLGKALEGKMAGDKVEFNTPSGGKIYVLKSIEAI